MAKVKPNVLIVIPSLTQGGSERQAVYYALALKKQGRYNPVIIGLGRSGELTEWMDAEGITYDTFSGQAFWAGSRWQKVRTLFSFLLFVRRFRPAYLLALTYWPTVLCGCVWRFSGARAFFWNQGSVDEAVPFSVWERIAQKMKPTYLANGHVPAQFISQRHGVPLSAINIIYNALEIPEELSTKVSDSLNLLMLANFFPEKDHATVLRAFTSISPRFPHAVLHFAGAAPGAGTGLLEAKALGYDLNLCGKVIFHGTVSDPSVLLRQAQIGILSTRSEGFSNALMEYMAYGLPVVATDIEANRDALGSENAPWLFAVGDLQGLAERLSSLMADESLRTSVGKQNRILALERFAINRFVTHVNALFAHAAG
jgi:glycosyltransferase involved in cell wall biosynthesis